MVYAYGAIGQEPSLFPGRLSLDYVKSFSFPVVLKDGSPAYLRPVCTDDVSLLSGMFSRLSEHSLYLRFHQTVVAVPVEEVQRLCDLDYWDTFGLSAIVPEGDGDRMVGIAHFYRLPSKDGAELALVVEDEFQNRGVGRLLMDYLTLIARERHVTRFQAVVLSENHRIIRLLERNARISQDLEYGICNVVMPIPPMPGQAHPRKKGGAQQSLACRPPMRTLP